MDKIKGVIEAVFNGFGNSALQTSQVFAVLGMAIILGIYEYIVYRLISHKDFYNKSFNIALTILPLLLSTIVLTVQSNIAITLGTIGVLAIIRFRTAIKDPVDMIYLLWSVHTGITCGCQIYEVSILTSIAITILLIVLNFMPFSKAPLIVVVNVASDKDTKDLNEQLLHLSKHVRIKSYNRSKTRIDYVLEISGANKSDIAEKLNDLNIDQYNIIEYDNEDLL